MTERKESTSLVRRLIFSEILIVVVLLFSVGVFRFLYASRPEVEQKEIDKVLLNVDVFECSPVDFQEMLTGFGTAQADREVILSAQVAGEVTEVNPLLKVGNSVSAASLEADSESPSQVRDADLLLKIDTRDYQQAVDQAETAIQEAQSEIDRLIVQEKNAKRQLETSRSVLQTLRQEYDRIQEGVSRRAASASELNRSLLEVQRYEDTIIQLENQLASLPLQKQAAQQRLARSRSQKQRAESDVSRTDIKPPFDGMISEVMVEQGQFVGVGAALLRLTDPQIVEVPVSLSFEDFLQIENDIAVGDRPVAELSESETDAARWSGRVVRAAPEADAMSRTVQVYVEVLNDDQQERLLPGAFVHTRIAGTFHEQTLLIPREAITDGAVFVVDDQNVTHRRPVKTGRRLQSMVIVTEGLNAGDRVVITNLDVVEDDQEVVVQSSIAVANEVDRASNTLIRLGRNAGSGSTQNGDNE